MTKYDFLIQSISDLDIDSVDMLLDDHRTYQDLPKHVFINRLKHALAEFAASGNQELIPYPGVCGSCNKGCKGYAFVGPNSLEHMDLLIEQDGENIKDIYTCSLLILDHKMQLGDHISVKSDRQLPEIDLDPPPF
jgi:hypothetical protein